MPADTRDSLPVVAERVRTLEAQSVNWITREEYTPVRLLVYGVTALMLMAVVVAMMTLVVKGP